MGLTSQALITSPDDLRSYLLKYVKPLHDSSLAVYRDYVGLVNLVTRRAISYEHSSSRSGNLFDWYYFNKDQLSSNIALQKLLLGGVRDDGTYSERSLAAFYKDVFHVYADENSLKDFLKDPDNKRLMAPFVNLGIDLPSLVGAAYWLHLTTHQALELASFEVKELDKGSGVYSNLSEIETLIVNNAMINDFVNFINAAINFSSVTNPATAFIWSMRRNFKEYLEAAYPQVFARGTDSWKELNSVLGVEENIGVLGGRVLSGYPEYARPEDGAVPVAFNSCGRSDDRSEATVGGRLSIANTIALSLLDPTDQDLLNIIEKYTVASETPSDKGLHAIELLKRSLLQREEQLLAEIGATLDSSLGFYMLPPPGQLRQGPYYLLDALNNALKDPSHTLSPNEVYAIGSLVSFNVELLKSSVSRLWSTHLLYHLSGPHSGNSLAVIFAYAMEDKLKCIKEPLKSIPSEQPGSSEAR